MMIPLTPASRAFSTSETMQREKAKTREGSPAEAMRLTASASAGDTAGMPASIRSTPAAASSSAMRIFWSAENSMPACCSPSRNVRSCTATRSGSEKPSLTSGW